MDIEFSSEPAEYRLYAHVRGPNGSSDIFSQPLRVVHLSGAHGLSPEGEAVPTRRRWEQDRAPAPAPALGD